MSVHSTKKKKKKPLKLKKLQFTPVAKVLAISIQITFEQFIAILARCIKRKRNKI
jgi:hypothetical protein